MFFFFFQAEDGIRDDLVTGVQTCALPISKFIKLAILLKISLKIFWKFWSADEKRTIKIKSTGTERKIPTIILLRVSDLSFPSNFFSFVCQLTKNLKKLLV